jgi:hypothetical protein
MAFGRFGADTDAIVTPSLLDAAKRQLGSSPEFWGRYFKAPKNTNPQQYQARQENSFLRSNNIQVLPLARQTNHVGGTSQMGDRDARGNAQAIIEAFGASYLSSLPNGVLVVLDAEMEAGQPNLSTEYYLGWSRGLIAEGQKPGNAIRFNPAAYCSRDATETWSALNAAIAQGASCAGAWIACYIAGKGLCAPAPTWSDARVTPPNLSCPVLAWQYLEECKTIDFNQANPAHQDNFLGQLVLPPPGLPALIALREDSAKVDPPSRKKKRSAARKNKKAKRRKTKAKVKRGKRKKRKLRTK